MIHRTIILADIHTGSTSALWPPEQQLGDGGMYTLNKVQQFLLVCWKDATRRIIRLKPDVVAVLGDVLQGNSIRDGQLVTNRSDIQGRATLKLLSPIREKARRFFMFKGTPWHEGKASESTGILAQALDAEVCPVTGEYLFWELYLQLPGGDEPIIHLTHHIGATKVSWYEATVPLRDTLMLLSELTRWYKDVSPNVRLTVRAHRHRCIGIYIAPDIHAWTTPCWQLKTAYAYQKSIVTLPHIGYLLIEWDGKDIVIKPRLYTVPLPHVEVFNAD